MMRSGPRRSGSPEDRQYFRNPAASLAMSGVYEHGQMPRAWWSMR